MKPKMLQKLTLEVAKTGANGKPLLDKYSKPIVEKQEFACRTRVNGETLRNSQISVEDARDELDVLPNTPVKENAKVIYTTTSGEVKQGTIKSIVETPNLTASKIYFKTCVING